MTSRKGREKITVEVPAETRQEMKDKDEPMWKLVDEGVKMALGLEDGGTEAAFERRINELEDKESTLKHEIEAKQEELESVREQLEREQERFDEFLANQDTIGELQDEILEDMVSTSHKVYAHRESLRELARREYGRETSENMQKVIADLKERRDEEDMAILDSQFADGVGSPEVSTADGGEPQFTALMEEDDD